MSVTQNVVFGDAGFGFFNQSDGTLTINGDMTLANQSGSLGFYDLSGGALTVNGNEYIGKTGGGTFTQSSKSTHEIFGDLFIDMSIPSGGTYNLNAGVLKVHQNEYLGNDAGAIGIVNQADGTTHTVDNNLIVGSAAGSEGTYNLSGGDLATLCTIVGQDGKGTFTQSGGTNTVTNDLNIGQFADSNGNYDLSNGTLSVGRNENVGLDGVGAFTQSGGDNTVASGLIVGGNSTGTFFLTGGNVSSGWFNAGVYGTGTFTQNGVSSTNTIGTFILGVNSTGVGIYNLADGTLTVNDRELIGDGGAGTFTQDGGTNYSEATAITGNNDNTSRYIQNGGANQITSDLTVGEGTVSKNLGTGIYELNSGALSVGGIERVGGYNTGSFVQQDGTHEVSGELRIASAAGSTGTFELKGGTLSVGDYESVGRAGTGTFTQTGGTHTLTGGDLYVGGSHYLDGSNVEHYYYGVGTYNLSGGYSQLSVTGSESIGYQNIGTFTQDGGSNMMTGDLNLGEVAGSNGTYELKDGNLNVGGAERIGWNGTGTFTQTGGTNTLTNNLSIGGDSGSSGTYTLGEGKMGLSVQGWEYVGDAGTGKFTQSGGAHTVGQDLYLGLNAGGNGTFELKGGNLNVAIKEILGSAGTAAFNQTGGTHSVGTNLYLGWDAAGTGSYDLGGTGDLNVSGWEHIGRFGTGVFTQEGGTHNIGENLTISKNPGSSHGTYNLSGGTLNVTTKASPANAGITNNGTFNYSGGDLNIKAGTFTNNAGFNLSGTGIRTINGDLTNASGGSIKVSDTTVDVKGTFINNGALISDPSTINFFGNAYVGSTGYFTGGAGDVFNFHAGLLSESTNPLWNTAGATLSFTGSGPHTLTLDPTNPNSFHWGTLALDSGAGLNFTDGLTGNLYVRDILVPDLALLSGISGNLNVYYGNIFRPLDGGGTEPWNLSGWTPPSNLTATPEPVSMLLFGLGAGVLGLTKLRRKKK